jgi:formiminotetrahydrofolate cyclodeaminase
MPRLSDHTLEEWIQVLARRSPTPAGGALALVSLAGAAALSAKMARLGGQRTESFESLARAFLEGAARDGESYSAAARGGAAEKRACLSLTLEHLRSAVAFLESLGPLFSGAEPDLAADVAAAERIGRAAAETCLVNLAVNLSVWSEAAGGGAEFAAALQELRERLGRA